MAAHMVGYSDDATATRVFFKDVPQWPIVSERDRGAAGVGGPGTGGDDPAEWLFSAGEPAGMGFGRGPLMHVPGADDMLLYEPHHATAYDLP